MNSLDSEITSLVSSSKRNQKAAEKLNYAVKKIKKELYSRTYKWMRCVLFPEYSKGARYPGRMPVESGVYTLQAEFTVKCPESQYFGLAIKPHSNNVTDPMLYEFPDAQFDDWGIGRSVSPYSNSQDNPLFPPEVFFGNTRLVGCSVHVECISQESSGRIKAGIEYDCNSDFYSPNQDTKKKISAMLHSACNATSIYYAARLVITQADRRVVGAAPVNYANPDARYIAYGQKFRELANIVVTDANVAAGLGTLAGVILQQSDNHSIIPLEGLNDGGDINIFDRAMTHWRRWYHLSSYGPLAPAGAGVDVQTMRSAYVHLLGTFRASLLWPENRFTTALANINQLDLFIGRTLTPFYDNATSDYVAFVARSAMRNILTVPRNLDSSQIKSGPLKYARLQYIAHRHENPFDEGIRVVYVPQRLDDIPFDKIPADMIFIGGVQVPRQAVLRITVIRHYEGQVHSGMKNLYPVYEQPEDEEAIKILSLLIKKYPQILLIRPRDLEGIYRQVKDKFKWVDTALREDGTGFEVIRDYTRPMELILPQTE